MPVDAVIRRRSPATLDAPLLLTNERAASGA